MVVQVEDIAAQAGCTGARNGYNVKHAEPAQAFAITATCLEQVLSSAQQLALMTVIHQKGPQCGPTHHHAHQRARLCHGTFSASLLTYANGTPCKVSGTCAHK